MARPQLAAHGKQTLARVKGDDVVKRRMVQAVALSLRGKPQVTQFFRREQRDVRAGRLFAQTQQRRRGHDRIAQPIHAAHENALGLSVAR